MALKVLDALDTAKTQYYHFKAIIIAGMGLFTDAYDLFCIPPIMRLIGRLYYPDFDDGDPNKSYQVPIAIASAMVAIALLGTVIGQLIFGYLGDRMGRRRVYGLALMCMVLSSIGCGFSICTSATCVSGLDLKCLNLWEHPFMEIQDKNEEALTDEILDVLKLVLEVHDLPLAQIWRTCRVCRSLFNNGVFVLSRMRGLSYLMEENGDIFLRACAHHHLKKGMGVVGTALQSLNLVFCADVTQFSIT